MGRIDFQVKVRGFRVELGEVEATLAELPGIAQAVVVAAADGDGEARLIAYLKAVEGSQPLSVASLREQLAARLPAYMIPSSWRYVDAYPLTANRKIDRKVLAAQCLDIARPDAVAPRTPLERALVEIWKQVLAMPELGVDDSFFDLGGHSLAAARIHTKLSDVFRVDVPLAEFLRRPTVAGLADLVQAHDPEPGRSARTAAAYLRVLSMSDEEKACLRARRKAE
jgi:acyl carrier protein